MLESDVRVKYANLVTQGNTWHCRPFPWQRTASCWSCCRRRRRSSRSAVQSCSTDNRGARPASGPPRRWPRSTCCKRRRSAEKRRRSLRLARSLNSRLSFDNGLLCPHENTGWSIWPRTTFCFLQIESCVET